MRIHCIAAFTVLLVALFGAGCRSSVSSVSPRPVAASAADASRPTDEAIERRARAMAAFGAGVIREMNDDSAGLLDFWTRAIEADPSNGLLAREVARRRLVRREFPAAVAILERATRSPGAPVDAGLWSLLGLAYIQSGRTNDAIVAYKNGLGDGPASLPAYASLGRLLVEGGRVGEAEALLERASAQATNNAIFHIDVAELYGTLAQRHTNLTARLKPRALAELDRVASLTPKDPLVLMRLADQNALLGRPETAEKILKGLVEGTARNPVASAKLVEIFLRSGRLDAAVEQLELLRRETPSNPMPPYYLGAIALERKDYVRAAGWFEKSVLLDPTNESAQVDLVSALLTSRRLEEALSAVRKAREHIRPSFRLEFLASIGFSRMKRHDEALDAMARAEKAADGDPRLLDHRFHFQFANTLELAGRSEDALKQAHRALEFQPEFPPALNFVGYSWADRNVRLPEAFAMIRRAVEAEPENPAYQDSLGWVLYRMGRFAEALPPLEKAAKAMGDEMDATVLEHLGDVLEALKRHDEAVAAWRKAAAIESSPSLRKKLGQVTP